MVFDWETSLIITLWWYYLHWNQFVYIYIYIYALNLSESWYIIVGHSMMFMSHAMLLCENPAGHPDWPTGTGSKPAASSKLCWGARVEMHSKEPRDGSFESFESFYVFRYVQSAYMRLFTSLPTFACNQVLRAKLKDLWAVIPTMSLWRCCWAHVEQLGQCRSVSFQTPSLQSFESADGRKLPKQRATVVTVAIVYVWIWDWAWDTCFVAVCGS